MAKITKEQYNKWANQALNGFTFDLQYYVLWSEKTLSKKVKRVNGDVVEFKIEYHKEFETKTNAYGCSWNVETGCYIPMLNITVWHPTHTGCYSSSGWAKSEKIGDVQNSKKYNVLCKLSGMIDTDKYMKEFA